MNSIGYYDMKSIGYYDMEKSIGYYDCDESSEQTSNDDSIEMNKIPIEIKVKVKDAFFNENDHLWITPNIQLGTFVIVNFTIK